MNRLMLDHFRRWAWVLAASVAAEFAVGWLVAANPELPFEFWAFLLALWAGATLVSFDLRRGVLRPVAVLPLTGRQLGRSWWAATVPIPAVTLAALLFAGAGAYCHFHPNHAFPAGTLALASLFNLVWLGMNFTMIFGGLGAVGGNWREAIGNSLVSLFAILMFFGSMVLSQGASQSPLKSAVLLGGGALLTFVSWLRADQFDPARAGFFLGRIEPLKPGGGGLRLTPVKPGTSPGAYRAPGGYGGISFLLSAMSVRAFLYVAAMIGLITLLWRWQSRGALRGQDLVLLATMGSFMSCWFIVCYQFMPIVRDVRFLRTLPIPATGLAAVMLALGLLPLIALGALAAGIAWAVLGSPAALTFLSNYIFILASAALGMFLAVWRGGGTQSYALVLLTMLGFLVGRMVLQARLHDAELTLRLAGAIAALGVLLALVLTWLALTRGGQAYRVQANPFGSFPLGSNR